MVTAPVGFQCPACVAQAQRRMPPVRTALGGRATRSHPRRVTNVLLGANVLVAALAWLTGAPAIAEFGMFGAAIATGEWWRLLTAPFVHSGLAHLGVNMLALWILGGVVEPLLGRWRFATVYLVSALGGAVVSYGLTDPRIVSVGASGAVFGLLGATLVVLVKLRRDVTGILVLLGINVAIGFVVPFIDWRAHLGGFVVGLIVTVAFVFPPPRLRGAVGWAVTALTLVTLAAFSGARTEQLLALLS